MKLLNCILFASFALGANFAHAGASCKDTAGYKLGTNTNALKDLDRAGDVANGPASNANGAGSRQ